MEIAAWILAGLLVLGGLAGTLLPVASSTPMILAGMLLAGWLDQFQRIGWITFTDPYQYLAHQSANLHRNLARPV